MSTLKALKSMGFSGKDFGVSDDQFATHFGGEGPFQITGARKRDTKATSIHLGNRIGQAGEQRGNIEDILFGALSDPTFGAGDFTGFFADAANANAEPIQRDFERTLASGTANVARRFGGNASSEELRTVGTTGEQFGDILGRQLASIGPQAVAAAQARAQILGGVRGQLASEEQSLLALLHDYLNSQKGPNIAGKILGAGAGITAGVLTGNPAVGLGVGQAVAG